jgi:hypothetical protein
VIINQYRINNKKIFCQGFKKKLILSAKGKV